jgi:hypothetical protein
MDARLEAHISTAVHRIHLVERALHSTGSWTMSAGDLTVPVTRTIDDSGITFEAEFPEHVWAEREATVALALDGEPQAWKDFEVSDAGFGVRWVFTVLVPA